LDGSEDTAKIDALLAEFDAAKQLSQTERNRGCARIAAQLAALTPGDYLREKLIGLLDSEPVTAFERRDLIYGAVWPDDWRSAAHGAVAKAFAGPEDHFAYLRDLAAGHRDADHQGEALQILARRYVGAPETFSVLAGIVDGYRESSWIRAQLRYAESGIISYFAHLPEALPYLIDSARDHNSDWSRNAAAMQALAEHHRDNPQTRALLEDVARRPRRASNDQAPGSALEVLVKYYPLNTGLCDLLAELIDLHEHPSEQHLIMTKLAKARYPRIKEILFKQARRAAHRDARALAIKLLTDRFGDEPGVPELLQDEPKPPDC